VDLDEFLKRAASSNGRQEGGRRAAGGRAGGGGRARPRAAEGRVVNDSLHDVRARLKISSQ